LGEALGFHDGGNFFALLREQKSNLWFIRSSKEISEKGLFVGLKGYETQVFLDIHEVEDDARGRWARLHHDLGGRGVPDLLDAIMDIFLGELYWRFTELIRPEIVTGLHEFFVDAKAGESAKPFIESIKIPAEAYFEAVSRFIGGADGQFDAWTPRKDGVNLVFNPVSKEKTRAEFEGFIERLIKISKYAGPETGAKTPEERLFVNLAGKIRDRRLLCAAALGYGLIAILRSIIGEGAGGVQAVSLGFDHWRLDRKLRDVYSGMGASDAEAWRLTDLTRAALVRAAPEDASPVMAAVFNDDRQFDTGQLGTMLIEENYQTEDFRRLLGINTFDDVTWFNKEGFEEALFYGTLFFTLESDSALRPAMAKAGSEKTAEKAKAAKTVKQVAAAKPAPKPLPWIERAARIGEISEALVKAEAGAGYRLDELINSLAGTRGAMPAAKPAAVKSEAKAKTAAKPAAIKKPAAAKKTTAKPGDQKSAVKGGKAGAKPEPKKPAKEKKKK
jgi:hypothetical protein